MARDKLPADSLTFDVVTYGSRYSVAFVPLAFGVVSALFILLVVFTREYNYLLGV